MCSPSETSCRFGSGRHHRSQPQTH
jgi:hypothetical protein